MENSVAERSNSTMDQRVPPECGWGQELAGLVWEVPSRARPTLCWLHGLNRQNCSQCSQVLSDCEHVRKLRARPERAFAEIPGWMLAEFAVIICARTLCALCFGSRRSPGPSISIALCGRSRDVVQAATSENEGQPCGPRGPPGCRSSHRRAQSCRLPSEACPSFEEQGCAVWPAPSAPPELDSGSLFLSVAATCRDLPGAVAAPTAVPPRLCGPSLRGQPSQREARGIQF